jgi:hypothetical protein
MPALQTFDWLKQELWPMLDEDGRAYLEQQRAYLLTLRNEDECRRLIDEVMENVRAMKKRKAAH